MKAAFVTSLFATGIVSIFAGTFLSRQQAATPQVVKPDSSLRAHRQRENKTEYFLKLQRVVGLHLQSDNRVSYDKLSQHRRDCVSTWSGIEEVSTLAQNAYLLPFQEDELTMLASKLDSVLNSSQIKVVLLNWSSQHSGEYLYSLLRSETKQSLCSDIRLITGLFGDRCVNVLMEDCFPDNSIKRIQLILKDIATSESGIPLWRLSEFFKSVPDGGREDLVRLLIECWPTVPDAAKSQVLKSAFDAIGPKNCALLAKTAVRYYAPNLVLQEFGESLCKSGGSVTDLVDELNRWDTEPSKSYIIKGYLEDDPRFTASEVYLLLSLTDDVVLRRRIEELEISPTWVGGR